MSNFIFLSPVRGITIENLKLTVRFSSENLIKSEWIFRIILKTSEIENIDKNFYLYLLLKKAQEEKVTIEKILDTEFHNQLKNEQYLEYCGRSFSILDRDANELTIHEKYEIPHLRKKTVILPTDISVKKESPHSPNLAGLALEKCAYITEEDTGVKIQWKETGLQPNKRYLMQFVLVLNNFIPLDVLRSMEEPGSGWSLAIDIHNKAIHTEVFSEVSLWLCNINSLELWMSMPHRHLILDSSPRYKALYWVGPYDKDKMEEFEKKFEGLKKTKEFKNPVGDIWLKIVQDGYGSDPPSNIEEEFTIIGFSPWIGSKLQDVAKKFEEKARNLVRNEQLNNEIKEINKSINKQKADIEKTYISYKDVIPAWGLLATMITFSLTFILVVIQELFNTTIIVPEIRQMTLKDVVLIGFVIGMAAILSYHLLKFIWKTLTSIIKR